MKRHAYGVEVGVLLPEDNREYENYLCWGMDRSYYDENQCFFDTEEEAKKFVDDYVADGVPRTYGLVCEILLDDEESVSEDGNILWNGNDMGYCLSDFVNIHSLESVVYQNNK